MALNPGHTLLNGHYRILRLLGRGGFGFVYEAQDMLLNEKVAIKELIPALVGDEAMLKRFLAEARATMRLRHKRIVATHNVFSEGENYYIVMECMAGGSLEERLRRDGLLSVDEAVQLGAEVCEGLACAHEEGVVHCDLKPHNILFDKSGHVKVADFGIAHVSDEMLTRSWHTPAGFVAGTLPYMSPEQTDGVRDDPRLDLYAVGALLYRALTGQTYVEFDQQETPRAQAENVGRIFGEQPLPPSHHNRSVPTWLDGVVLKALAKKPEERYSSAHAMRAALVRQQLATVPDAAPPPLPSTGLTSPQPTLGSRPIQGQRTPAEPAERAATATVGKAPLPGWFWPAAGAAAVLLVVIIIAVAALLGDGDGGSVARANATVTEAGTATLTPMRTPVPQALPAETTIPTSASSTEIARPLETTTNTARPPDKGSPTPLPTDTPHPTATETVAPTATRTSAPTATPVPPTPKPKGIGKIVYAVGSYQQGYTINVTNSDGSANRQLLGPGSYYRPVWSPNGTRIALTCDGNLCLMNQDGSGLVSLNQTGSPATWSPSGTRLLFNDNVRSGDPEVYVVGVDGSGLVRLTNSHLEQDSAGSWSPDGKHIAYVTKDSAGKSPNLFVIDPDGSNRIRVNPDLGYGSSASWSPDSKRLAFACKGEICITRPDGSELVRLKTAASVYSEAVWSPDGKRIAFSSSGTDAGLFVINSDGSHETKLAGNLPYRHLSSISWSPDGSQLAFLTLNGPNVNVAYWGVYVVNASGSAAKRLTHEALHVAGYSWAPE